MPRNSLDAYTLPTGSTAVAGETISANTYNSTIQDLAAEQIATRPIAAGGTGATTATEARDKLGLTALLADKMDADADIPPSQITDLDSHIKDTAGTILAGGGATTVSYDATTNIATISSTDNDTTYSAGNGLDLSGTNQFAVKGDIIDVDSIGKDAGDKIVFSNNNRIEFHVNGGEEMRLLSSGALHVDNDIIAYSNTISDPRLKTDVVRIDDALERVQALTGYEFTYKHDGRASAGVMSDEVGKVLPCAVTETDLAFHGGEGELYDVVQYDQLHALLIEAVKTLAERVEALKNGG